MGKTVKGRVFISITAFICVIAICLIANKGVPSLYASHREKVAAQDSATRVVEQVKKPKTTTAATTTTTAETTTEAITEDANIYDITEDSASEEAVTEEEPTEEEEDTTAPDNQDNSSKSFLDKVIDFFTTIFEAITSGNLLEKIKEFISGLFGKIGL